ncbi:MAG: type II toxin-antitoxin system VapC family toxin [Chitinophagales bacterium]
MADSRMVVDTSIFIEHLRARDKMTTGLYNLPNDATLLISSVTLYELYLGARDEGKWNDVEALTLGIPVLPFNYEVSIEAAKIYHELRRSNNMIEFRDIFIGATARVYDIPIKTLNKRHFKRIEGLTVLD